MSYSTDITIVLDRSGSMQTIREDTIGGFNSFLKEQKETDDGDRLTLVQFDNQYEVVHDDIALAEVQPLDDKTFVPRGGTALLDAIGRTINSTGARLSALDEKDRPEKVIFVIITDGAENQSREFSHKQAMEMIGHQTDKYDWQFMFIGANQDAIGVGRALGIAAGSSMSYAASNIGTQNAWKGFSRSVTSRKRGASLQKCSFTDKEREDSAKED
jgi:Mg-chelatase subunit ChlD